jgi:hypothetical protein
MDSRKHSDTGESWAMVIGIKRAIVSGGKPSLNGSAGNSNKKNVCFV